ncbi:RnfABCDGE type electron transport complex subunit D [Bdellovibrio sp. GT3]|uniref:RnfABCDGE type electron transport complex subunit D n=1 Tax=Bdellovibrio sp. GT3 TaxID=3136282 RepID=UPI0030F368CE
MKWFNLKDPRLPILIFLLSFVVYALQSPGFVRTPWQFVGSLVTSLAVDYALIRFYKKANFFPLSGLISSLGFFLLLDSPYVWPYIVGAALMNISKHFFTAYGRHIFNPNNFGLVVMVFCFPMAATTTAGRWGGGTELAFILIALGFFAAYRAQRWVLSVTYISVFFLGALLRAHLLKLSLAPLLAPMTGAAFILISFYMMTDPATSPKSKKMQVLQGVFIASLDTYLRMQQFKYAPFVTVFVACALYSSLRFLDQPRRELAKP